MIYNNHCTFPTEYLEQLTEDGLESLPEMIRLLVNQAMQIERNKHLNTKPYEHSDAFSSSVILDRTCLISIRLLSGSIEIQKLNRLTQSLRC